MRASYSVFGIAFVVFGSAVATTRQQPPLAEQQFKNIKSFKGEKASDVIPAMEFISASLGVGCDYCHTADRASDSKEPKDTARMMIAMQRDINAKNFGGRNVVTCATCHGGHTHPLPIPPVAGVDVRPRRSQDVNPEQVLAAYAKAVGIAAAQPAPSLRLDGTSVARGETTRLEATYAGGKFQFTTRGPKGEQKQGFNGSAAWFTQPPAPNETKPLVRQIPLAYAESFINQNAIFIGPDTLPKLTDPRGGTAKIADKDMQVVSGTITGGTTRLALFFDKQTGLLARSAYSYPTILGSIAEINDYSDYRPSAGIQLPMTIATHSSQGDSTMHFRSAHLNPKLDPTLFDPPK